VRYADGPSTQVEVVVDAPPEAVWALITDIELPGRFSSEFVRGEWLDGGGPALGARFVGHNRHPAAGEWQTTSTIVDFEAGRRFGWAVGDPEHPSATWRFELEPAGAGSRLRQWMRLGPGPSGLSVVIEQMPDKEERIVERRVAEHRRNMEATVKGIKALAEGSGA